VPDEVMPTVSAGAVVTLFQFASTAFTVTVNDDPADRALGLPVLPLPLLDVPGAAVSPGTRSCSFVNVPTFTVIEGLVSAVFVPSVISVAVSVLVAAVVRVPLTVWVP